MSARNIPNAEKDFGLPPGAKTLEELCAGPAAPRATFSPIELESDAARCSGATVPACDAVKMAAEVRDVLMGIQTIMQIVESDSLNDEEAETEGQPSLTPPVLSRLHRGHLLRMAIACAGSLAERAAVFCEDVDRQVSATEQEASDGSVNGNNPQA